MEIPDSVLQQVRNYCLTVQKFRDGTTGGMQDLALLNLAACIGESIVRTVASVKFDGYHDEEGTHWYPEGFGPTHR